MRRASRILASQRPVPRLRLVRAEDPPPLDLGDMDGEVMPKLRDVPVPVPARWRDAVLLAIAVVIGLLGLVAAMYVGMWTYVPEGAPPIDIVPGAYEVTRETTPPVSGTGME